VFSSVASWIVLMGVDIGEFLIRSPRRVFARGVGSDRSSRISKE
jgi:hypothetical protein